MTYQIFLLKKWILKKVLKALSLIQLAVGLVSLFKPVIENLIEESFDDFWEDEVETIENKETESDLNNTLESFRMSYLNRAGKIAELGLEGKNPDSGELLKIEFKLNKIEDHWRVKTFQT